MTEQEVKDLIGKTVTYCWKYESGGGRSMTGVIEEVTVRLESGRYWIPSIAQAELNEGKK